VSLRLSDDHARSLAAIGLIGLVLAVTAYGQQKIVHGIPLDTIILGVPFAILLALPYVWRVGIGSAPKYLLGPAALLFLAWGMASVVATGGDISTWLTMARYASYFILAIVVSVVAQDAAVRRLLLWTIVLSGTATAILAYAQYANPTLTPGMHGISAEITTRVVGTFYNSNFYAEYLLLVLGIVMGFLFTESPKGRIVAGVCGLVMLGAFLLTYTRGSWMGLGVALLVFIIVVDVRYLAAIALLGVAALFVPGVRARLTQSAENGGSADFRLGIWKIAGEAIRRHPWFGYGPGDFLTAYRDVVMTKPEYFQGYLGFGAHNSYFELAAEAGVFAGLTFFVITLVYATRGVFLAVRTRVDRETKYLSLGISAVLIGFVANTFTSNTFQHPQSGLFFWILSGVVAALGAGLWTRETRSSAESAHPAGALSAGSFAAGWATYTRHWIRDMWRSSTAFAASASPRHESGRWFESSLFLRGLLGAGRGKRSGE
jgi:O-antigen ligase